MNTLIIDVKDLYEFLSEGGEASVETPTGITPIRDSVKKEQVETVIVTFPDHVRHVAATHRFSCNGEEVFAKDAVFVDTKNGTVEVSVENSTIEDVYDILIDDPHWYYDQYGVIHHNTGKSLGLCHLAATYLQQGRNVLYVSMEMAEHMVAKRIDANLLDVSMDDIDDGIVTYSTYKTKMENLNKKGLGRLIIKQFPTGGASVNHINSLLNELWTKKQWKPEIIIVDYLGIMTSSRIKVFSENSYTLVKAIAEELRGLAIEHDVVVWSAAQTTRGGWDSSDINMSDIAESAGLAATADFILAVMETEDLAEIGQQAFKQIKSRYGDKNKNSRFTMIVEKDKQRWLQCEDTGTDRKTVEQASREMQAQANENASSRSKMNKFTNDANDVEWS